MGFPEFSYDGHNRTALDQYNWMASHTGSSGKLYTRQVAMGDLKIGDVIFYNYSGGRAVDHVAFYAGGGRVFHAYNYGHPVEYTDIDYVAGRFAAFRLQGKVNV